ncbi:MAG: L-seryl-tRNA(Sec) selenium transferase, partial [Desulfobacula sp.]|nr:L-seryl-tRNA(Sec) selenium transferase [Desulfobacula sp.]
MTRSSKHTMLKNLPGVDHLLEMAKQKSDFSDVPRSVIVDSLRHILENRRNNILNNIDTDISDKTILDEALMLANQTIKPRLVNVINATGVVLHTNLGRALLCDDALNNIRDISQSYSNLEMDIEKGKRGIRYEAIDELICE